MSYDLEFPLVKVGYVDLEGNEHTALMVVDSSSCNNVLFETRAKKQGKSRLLMEET